ncbi:MULTISPECIES: hypothetical protein [Olivibacter]|uniref:Virion structural protein n=1 Tax=Olivibacter jilunii TaxID=985016 RepID=A0ABW6B149_9SPHI
MPIIQKPEALNHSATLPDIILETSDAVDFVLNRGADTIIEERYYPDGSNRIKIRLRDLIDDLIGPAMPSFDQDLTIQSDNLADFASTVNEISGYNYTAKSNIIYESTQIRILNMDDEEEWLTISPLGTISFQAKRIISANSRIVVTQLDPVYGTEMFTFSVIKGYLQRQPFNLDYFLKSNWLTQQPRTKILKLQDPEWLNCYTPVACSVKVQATYDDDTMQRYDLVELDAEKYYSIDVRPGRIASMSVKKLVAYEVWTEAGGIQTRYKQAYWITDQYYDYYDVFLFENRFGGIDSIVFTGQLTRRDSIVVESAVFDEETFDYFVDPDLTIEKHTGYFLSPQHRNHALDFLRSKQKYHIVGGKPVRISVSATQYESIDGQLNSFPFTFRYSDVKDNIPNLGTTLNNLTIQ